MLSLRLSGLPGGNIGGAYAALNALVVALALLVAGGAGPRALAQAYPRGPALYPVAALVAYYYGQSAPAAVAAAAALPVLAQHRVGYAVFHLANALGVYRAACSGHVLAALAHAAFSASTVSQEGRQAIRTLLGRLFFVREIQHIRLSRLRKLTPADVWELPSRHRLENAHRELTYNVNQTFFLPQAIMRMLWWPLLPLLLLQAALRTLNIAKVAARHHLFACLGAPASYPWYHGYVAVLCELLLALLSEQDRQINSITNAEIQRVACTLSAELFRLPLMRNDQRRHSAERSRRSNTNYIIWNLDQTLTAIPRAISAFVSFVALYYHVGWMATVPILATIAVGTLVALSRLAFGMPIDWMPKTHATYDTRANDIYARIRTIKLFGWERMHTDPKLITQDEATRRLPWYAPAVYIYLISLDIVSVATQAGSSYLMMRMYLAGQSPAAAGHSYTALINMYQHARTISADAQWITKSISSARRAFKMIFELEDDIRGQPFHRLPQREAAQPGGKPAVEMSGCSFTWNKRACSPVLEDVSLDAKDGELVAVVGKTGSGKSSLLLAICGELEMTGGSGGVTGTMAYLEQQPWIMNDTMRANVLFGREYDQAFFEQVVHACALTDDLARWPDADLTVIGERGINISGGQRARLGLARALYSRANVYVLDDPLSAVDAHVKRHILDHVLLGSGMLAGKLRIVATNSDHILPYAHQVVTLENRRAVVTAQVPQVYNPLSLGNLAADNPATPGDADLDDTDAEEDVGSPAADNRQVAEVPKRSYWDNAVYIFGLCGWPVLLAIAASSLVGPVGYHIVDTIQFAIGIGANGALPQDDALAYMRLRFISHALYRVNHYAQEFVQEAIARCHLEVRVKDQLVWSILHAPMTFFDSITRQHLSSAYKGGADAMSKTLPRLFTEQLSGAIESALAVYRIGRTAPYLFLIVPLIAWLKHKQNTMAISAMSVLEETKHKVGITRSRMTFIVGDGEQLIRLFGVGPYFARLKMREEDEMTRLVAHTDALDVFDEILSKISDHIGSAVTAALLLLRAQASRMGVSPGALEVYRDLVELLLHNTHTVADLHNRIRKLSDIVDVYRQYSSIEPEAPYVVEGRRPEATWPQAGRVEFRDFSLRYRADLPPALDSVNLTINAGEKIGIVGRTGAGKSTLAKALFRLVHGTTSGSIFIDGQDILEMGVGDLRPRLGTIPQEAATFDGSYRKNLDPLHEHTVEDMWAALIKAGIAAEVAPRCAAPGDDSANDNVWYEEYMWAMAEDNRRRAESGWAIWLLQLLFVARPDRPIKRHMSPPHGLHRTVQDTARGLSSGQEQLFGLCRVLMRKRRVIVLDEATANVDLETDRRMQRVIRDEFKDHTVLTVAHRLETIMDCDRIVVMDRGRIAEVGSPKDLIDAGGHFAALVKANDLGS